MRWPLLAFSIVLVFKPLNAPIAGLGIALRLARFACLPLLVLLGALLGLLRLQRLLLLRLPLRLFVQGALTQRGFILPVLLILLAGGFKLLALLVAQQPLLLALGLRLRVASGVWPGLLV